MPSTRRSFAGVVAAAMLSLSSGCLSSLTGDANVTVPSGNSTPTAESTPEPTRGEAAALSVSETIDDVEYVPENETVKIVTGYRHTNHEAVKNGSKPEREPMYDEIPWKQWATTECASVAGTAVHDMLTDKFGDNHGVSVGVTSQYGDDPSLSVAHTILYNRDGEQISETSVGFDRLVEVTPREVTATVTLDGRTATRTIPAWVEYSKMHQT
ncbi:hypothetical protein [Halogeometricum borinquense]|nr:hypothetical protein [Halogeometricum borinquense]